MGFLDILGDIAFPLVGPWVSLFRSLTGSGASQSVSGKITTAGYGRAVPVVYGKNRISGNVIWAPKDAYVYAGINGSGDSKKYLQAMAIALCEGPVTLPGNSPGLRVWRDRGVFPSISSSLYYPQNPDPHIIPTAYAGSRSQVSFDYAGNTLLPKNGYRSVTIRLPASFPGTYQLPDPNYVPWAGGKHTFLSDWGPAGAADTGNIIYEFGNPLHPGVSETQDPGGPIFSFSSSTPSYLANHYAVLQYYTLIPFAQYAVDYRGTAYYIAPGWFLGDSNDVGTLSYEVRGFTEIGGQDTVNPAFIIKDIITNNIYGLGWASATVQTDVGQDGLAQSSYRRYCDAMGFLLAPAFTEQRSALDHIRDLLDASNSEIIWSPDVTSPEGVVKVFPLGDQPVTGNGVTYTPAYWDGSGVPVRYALTNNNFLPGDGGGSPVSVRRTSDADVFNSAPVEFVNSMPLATDATNLYNASIAEHILQDVASVGGLVKKGATRSLPCITKLDIAQRISAIRAQRSCYIRNTYRFRIDFRFAALEPLDMVSLTEPTLGLSAKPCRIVSVEEDQQGTLTIEAEEWPFGVAHAAAYATQDGDAGAGQNYNVDPLTAYPPMIVVAPIAATADGTPELWLTTNGGPQWGGARVWISWDNSTYTLAGEIKRGNFGVLQQVLPVGTPLDAASTLTVDMTRSEGSLYSVSAADRDALKSACWVDGEIVSYANAAVTAGQNGRVFDLTSLRRGCLSTVSSSHPVGAQFMRLDGNVLRVKFDPSHLGHTVYVKLVSFNTTGTTTQNDATAAVFTLFVPAVSLIGSVPAIIYFDAFNLDEWDEIPALTGTLSLQGGAVSGGKVLRATGGNVCLVHKALVPYDPSKTYRSYARVRQQVAGVSAGNMWVGFCGVASDGVTIVNTIGAVDFFSQHYVSFAPTFSPPDTTWHEINGYWKGRGTPGTGGGVTSQTPGVAHSNVAFVRLLLYMEPASGGALEIDALEFLDASAQAAADHAQADVSSILTLPSGINSYYQSTAPTAGLHSGDVWFDTTGGFYRPYRWSSVAGWQPVHDASLVVSAEIAAGAIVADKIAANAVTAAHMTIGNLDNLWPNGNSAATPPAGADTTTAEWAFRRNITGGWVRDIAGAGASLSCVIPASEGETYYAEALIQANVFGANKGGYLRIDFGNSGTFTPGPQSAHIDGDWLKASVVSVTSPAGTTAVRFVLLAGSDAAAEAFFRAIYCRRSVDGALVVAGGITADKIAALALIGKVVKTANFAEAGGTVSAGAILDGSATSDTTPPVRVSAAGIQIGSTKVNQAWFTNMRLSAIRLGYPAGVLASWGRMGIVSWGASTTANAIDVRFTNTGQMYGFLIANCDDPRWVLVKIADDTWGTITVQLKDNNGNIIATPWPAARVLECIIGGVGYNGPQPIM